jgi:hypothetical protein
MNIVSCEYKKNEIVINLDEKVSPIQFVHSITPLLQDLLSDINIKSTNITKSFAGNIENVVYYGIGESKTKPLFIVAGDRSKRSNEYLLINYGAPSNQYFKLVEQLDNSFGPMNRA